MGVFVRRPAGYRCCVTDESLRPLRGGDEQDEMLRLVGLPNVGAPQAA
jgi:hypothetical protein